MQLLLPEDSLPATLALNPELRMSDDEYFDFCMANPDMRFERMSTGEIVVSAPAGAESDHRRVEVGFQLGLWAKHERLGHVFGSSATFILPDRSALSPGVAWVSKTRLSGLTRSQIRKFPPVCPEFVVEVMSPSGRLKDAKARMTKWVANGVELGWLIDADNEAVYVYRRGAAKPTRKSRIAELEGEGPVAGFVLVLTDVWEEL